MSESEPDGSTRSSGWQIVNSTNSSDKTSCDDDKSDSSIDVLSLETDDLDVDDLDHDEDDLGSRDDRSLTSGQPVLPSHPYFILRVSSSEPDCTTESDSSDESDASDAGSCDGFRVVRRRSHTLPEHLPVPPVDPTISPLEGPSEDCSKSLSSICTDSSEDATSDPDLQQNTEAEMVPEVAKEFEIVPVVTDSELQSDAYKETSDMKDVSDGAEVEVLRENVEATHPPDEITHGNGETTLTAVGNGDDEEFLMIGDILDGLHVSTDELEVTDDLAASVHHHPCDMSDCRSGYDSNKKTDTPKPENDVSVNVTTGQAQSQNWVVVVVVVVYMFGMFIGCWIGHIGNTKFKEELQARENKVIDLHYKYEEVNHKYELFHQESTEEVRKLKEEVGCYLEENKDLKEALTKYQEEVDSIREERGTLRGLSQEEKRDLQFRLGNMEDLNENLNKAIRDKDLELKDLMEQFNLKTKENQNLQEDVNTQKNKVKTLEKVVEDLEDDIFKLNRVQANEQTWMDALHGKVAEVEEMNKILTKIVEEKTSEVKELEKVKKQMVHEYNAEVKDLNGKLRVLEEKKQDLSQKIEKLKHEHSKHRKKEKVQKDKRSNKSEEKEDSDETPKWKKSFDRVLNSTRSSMSYMSKQIEETWHHVRNLSKDLWKTHEPVVQKLQRDFVKTVGDFATHVKNKIKEQNLWRGKKKDRKSHWKAKNRKHDRGHFNAQYDDQKYAKTSRRSEQKEKQRTQEWIPDFDSEENGKQDKSRQEKVKKDKRSKKSEEKEDSDETPKWKKSFDRVLNSTRSSMSYMSKQIEETWHHVRNLSQDLWKTHEPVVRKLQQDFVKTVGDFATHIKKKIKKQNLWRGKKRDRKHHWKAKNRKQGKGHFNAHYDDHEQAKPSRSFEQKEKQRNQEWMPNFDPKENGKHGKEIKKRLKELKYRVKNMDRKTFRMMHFITRVSVYDAFNDFSEQDYMKKLSKGDAEWINCQKDWWWNTVSYQSGTLVVLKPKCRSRFSWWQKDISDREDWECEKSATYSKVNDKFYKMNKDHEDNNGKGNPHDHYKENFKHSSEHLKEGPLTKTQNISMKYFSDCNPDDEACRKLARTQSWYLRQMYHRSHLRHADEVQNEKSRWMFDRAKARKEHRVKEEEAEERAKWQFRQARGREESRGAWDSEDFNEDDDTEYSDDDSSESDSATDAFDFSFSSTSFADDLSWFGDE